jgi:hypothetical protein
MSDTYKIGEQIQSVRTAARMIHGAVKPPRGAAERERLANCVNAAADTLEKLRENTPAIRTGQDAVALLRRRLPDLPDDVRAEVVALLGDGGKK